MRTPARLALTALLAAGFALGLAPSAAVADTSDFTFDSFDAEYTLSREADGTATLQVVETIVARFPDFDQIRGIIDEELEGVWNGSKSAKDALDSAVSRGDELLRRFEQANR